MDNQDRDDIENHLVTIDQNNHNLIKNLNQQIKINENFNKTFTQIRDIIEADRKQILNKFNRLNATEMKIISEYSFLEQMFKLDFIERQVEHIQDNISSARLGLLHPNILTDDEINSYNIDFNKLSNIRLAVAKHVDNSIIFAIKIPTHSIKISKNLLIPITNSTGFQVDSEIEHIIRYNNQTLSFVEGKILKELKQSKNCISLKNCKIIKKKSYEILHIEENILIINNIKFGKLKSTCDERVLILKGNYMINFSNCTIKINNTEYSNKQKIFTEKFVLQNMENVSMENSEISFEKIKFNIENNINQIDEIKYHRNITYTLSSFTLIIIFILVIFIYCKLRRTNVKIINRIQENPKTKGGEVISHSDTNIEKNKSFNEIIEKYKH